MGNPTSLFADPSVLVTGGTGSFGRRFTQNLLALARPSKVIVFSRDELVSRYGTQWIDEEAVVEVTAVLRSGWLAQSPAVERFEGKVAEVTGARYAVAVSG